MLLMGDPVSRIRTRQDLRQQEAPYGADACVLPPTRAWGEIKPDCERRLASGQFRQPQRPALTYMTSSAQAITDSNGKHATRFLPRLIAFFPNMLSLLGVPPDFRG